MNTCGLSFNIADGVSCGSILQASVWLRKVLSNAEVIQVRPNSLLIYSYSTNKSFAPIWVELFKIVKIQSFLTYSIGLLFFFFFWGGAVLGLEFRDYTLSQPTSPFILWCTFFKIGSHGLFALLASDRNPPDLCLLSS
jgi:hypothetical protein